MVGDHAHLLHPNTLLLIPPLCFHIHSKHHGAKQNSNICGWPRQVKAVNSCEVTSESVSLQSCAMRLAGRFILYVMRLFSCKICIQPLFRLSPVWEARVNHGWLMPLLSLHGRLSLKWGGLWYDPWASKWGQHLKYTALSGAYNVWAMFIKARDLYFN